MSKLLPETYLMTYMETLSRILENLSIDPQMVSSRELTKYIQDAIACYQQISQYLEVILEERRESAKQQYLLETEPNDILILNDESRWRSRYEVIRDAGGTPHLLDNVAKAEGMGGISRIRVLRTIFDLNLEQAQEIIHSS